jgi:hypothetical protein
MQTFFGMIDGEYNVVLIWVMIPRSFVGRYEHLRRICCLGCDFEDGSRKSLCSSVA